MVAGQLFPERVLGAVPLGFLDASPVSAGQAGALDAVVGPSPTALALAEEEEEDGSLRGSRIHAGPC